jgi:hypothetical protein
VSFVISKPSHMSLHLQPVFNDIVLGNATGFVAKSPNGMPFLVTNRHVVRGRDNDTDECLDTKTLAVPNRLRVTHNWAPMFGRFVEIEIPLLNEQGEPLWFEHPGHKGAADVVVIPLSLHADIAFYPYDVNALSHNIIEPGSLIWAVGFPFDQRTGESFAVWSTGFVATEPQIDHGGRPIFLIDCRTRAGQSGSPVISFEGGHGAFLRQGERNINHGRINLLGIYSGRIHKDSDLGRVWKSFVLAETLTNAQVQIEKR